MSLLCSVFQWCMSSQTILITVNHESLHSLSSAGFLSILHPITLLQTHYSTWKVSKMFLPKVFVAWFPLLKHSSKILVYLKAFHSFPCLTKFHFLRDAIIILLYPLLCFSSWHFHYLMPIFCHWIISFPKYFH